MQHNQNKANYTISVNQLADFTRGSEAKRLSIIRQQKKPAIITVARYSLAKARFIKSIISKGDISPILLGIEELRTKNTETDWQANDKKVSLEAMEHFVKLQLPTLLKDLDNYEILPKFSLKSFALSDVNIIVSPDVIIKGNIGNKTYIGAIKIHMSKSAPFSSDESKYVAACIYNYLKSEVKDKNIIVLPELCLCIDVFGDSIISAPKNIKYVNSKLKEYCENIIDIWNTSSGIPKKNINPPRYSKTEIKKAGNILKNKDLHSKDRVQEAENVLTYWRTLHSIPLSELNQHIYIIGLPDLQSLISKRIKRSASIINKLEREKTTNLTTMQDLAGYRVVLPSIADVYNFYNEVLSSTNETNTLIIQEKYTKDYIVLPKNSGYRGIHLIFRFVAKEYIDGYEYLNIELQIRTKLQHLWATAVETAGIFKNFSLKANEGPSEWLEFFKLASASFSIYENCPKNIEFEDIPNLKIFTNTVEQFKELEVEKILKGVTVAFEHIKEKKYESESYNLVTLNLDKRIVNIKNFSSTELELANNAYTECERQIENGENLNVVLVSTNSITELQKAYPSYFGDADEFINKIYEIEMIIEEAY